MRRALCLLAPLLVCMVGSLSAAPQEASGLWTFDRYLSYTEVTAHVQDLARRRPDLVRLKSMGKSIEGRDLWVLEITNLTTGKAEEKPAVYLQGGIHGNEISSVMVPLYVAWSLVLDWQRE